MSPRPFKMRLGDILVIALVWLVVIGVDTLQGNPSDDDALKRTILGFIAVLAWFEAREANWRAREAETTYEKLRKALQRKGHLSDD